MSMFGKKISIEEGSKYDTSKISSEGISKEQRAELEKKNKKLIEVFKAFDQDGDGDLNKLELAAAMDAFSKMDSEKKDGKLSNKELQQGANNLNQFFKDKNVNIQAKGLKAFLKEITKLTQNDPKVETQQVITDYQTEQAEKLKQQQQNPTPPPSQEPKQEEPPQEPKKLNTYTVQEGESFTELIKKDLKSQGIENPTKEQIKEAKEKFKENNPNAVKTAKNGTEYLMVGDKVNLEGTLEDKNNANEQIKQYADKYPPTPPQPAKEKTPPTTTPPAAEEPPTTPPVKETPPTEQEIPKTKAEAAKALGLRETFASQSRGVYYDEKTQTHYQWNEESQKFEAMGENFRMIGKNGRKYDKNGKSFSGNYQLKKDGTEVYTNEDGSTSTYTYDAKGNKTKCVFKDANGKVTKSYESTYDTNGNRRTVYKDADGKVCLEELRSKG